MPGMGGQYHRNIQLVMIVGVVHFSWAQMRDISGVVTDENNVPLPGVNITVEGTSRGTQTDFDGIISS